MTKKYIMTIAQLKSVFPVGSQVVFRERFKAGEWYGGSRLARDRANENRGVVEDYSGEGDHLCMRIRLTGGYLHDNPDYRHEHVWHAVNTHNTELEHAGSPARPIRSRSDLEPES